MPATLDRFGISQMFPTITGGREWQAAWDNGHPRLLDRVGPDSDDCQFHKHGNGSVAIDGFGIARLQGDSPRMYVYDNINDLNWKNVEVTFYGMRISETQPKSSQGFVCGARSDHQDADENPCNAHTYYGRLLYDGRVHFWKEMKHRYNPSKIWDVENRPDDSSRYPWPTEDQQMPKRQWIGVKYVVRNFDADTKVRLSLYMDLTTGASGGDWQKLIEIDDTGDWRHNGVADCGFDPDQVWRDPAKSVFIRNDYLTAADYMKFSIREIEPA